MARQIATSFASLRNNSVFLAARSSCFQGRAAEPNGFVFSVPDKSQPEFPLGALTGTTRAITRTAHTRNHR